MLRTSIFIFLSSLLIVVAGSKNASAPDPLSDSVSRASSWLLSERRDDSGWGTLTPRVVVALEMGAGLAPLPPADRELLTKQLNVLLSLELGKDKSTESLSLSRLALFVNALTATCQNPRNFHGIDLVEALRRRTDANPRESALFPIAYLALCVAGEWAHRDMNSLASMFRNHTKMDLQAIDLMAMTCITQQKSAYSSYKSYTESFIQDFTSRFRQIEETSDVYTMALAYQAIQSGGGSANVSALSSRQLPSGSFGCVLATYQAIPALLGKSLGQIRCNRKGDKVRRVSNSPLSTTGGLRVTYTLQIGEKNDRDMHTVTVTVPSMNATFLDVMRAAEEKNPAFRFQTQETSNGLRVYELAGVPNDVELEFYWTLFKTPRDPTDGTKRHRKAIKQGLEKVFPADEEHFIFWFKRRTCSVTEHALSQCDF